MTERAAKKGRLESCGASVYLTERVAKKDQLECVGVSVYLTERAAKKDRPCADLHPMTA